MKQRFIVDVEVRPGEKPLSAAWIELALLQWGSGLIYHDDIKVTEQPLDPAGPAALLVPGKPVHEPRGLG